MKYSGRSFEKMRKKPLILVAFLMMSLFMIPSVTAGYGDESPQSITSFSETLPDDVLFFPDPVSIVSDIYFADSGDGDWENTFEKDEVYFNITDGDDLDMHFVCNATNVLIEKWEYATFGFEIDDDGNSKYYQYPGWTQFITFNVTPSWYNGSIEPAGGLHGISNNYTLTLKFSIDYSATLCIDYVHIRFTYVPLSASDSYSAGFVDVSDWQGSGREGEDSFSTDGDVLSNEFYWNGGTDWDHLYSNIPSLSNTQDNYYIEIHHKVNVTEFGLQYIVVYTADDVGGSEQGFTLTKYTGWHTEKFLITDINTVESVNLRVYTTDIYDDSTKWEVDYIRIFPADESGGYQHDGSTTVGIEAFNGGSISSDGDYLSLISDADGAIFNFSMDTTTTKSSISSILYPFWQVTVHSGDIGDSIGLRSLNSEGSWNTFQNQMTITDTTMRWNVKVALAGYGLEVMQIWGYSSQTLRVDIVKMYSIAYYTLTQSAGCSTSDVFYVDSGALIGSKTTDGYQTFWYDPVLSVDTEIYNIVEANITKALYPNVVGFNWAGTITGIGETWYLVDEKRAVLDASSLTAMRFSIDVLGDWTLYGIAYVDDHTWRGFTTVTVWFEVEAFVGSLNMLLIFGGLILIPASTLYAVKGGREEMNTDKLFYFLIAFVIGWALVIGGIYA
jgi:hypothetical protein